MFSLFKKTHVESPGIDDDGDKCPEKMSLDERKAWRASMLCKSIHDVLSSLGITPKMYKFKIMATDDRGHYYAVMIETLRHFSSTEYTTSKKLLDIEIILKTRTFDSYGIVVDGVYWKTDETIELFESSNTASARGNKHRKTIHDLRDMVLSDTVDKHSALVHTDHVKKDTFSANGKIYDTDLSPLGPD